MDVLRRIRNLMDERGWSLYRLSMESGVPQSTLSNMFLRNNLPTLPTLELICEGLSVSLPQFFTEDGDPLYLTSEQRRLIDGYSRLNQRQRAAVEEIMECMKYPPARQK